MKIKDCMSKDVEYLTPNTTIKDCAKLMYEKHIGCVPICDSNKNVIGLVTDRDLILRSIACGKDVVHTTLNDVMTTNVYTCYENEDVEKAQNIMSKNQIRRLPITDNKGKIVGIVTLKNLCTNQFINPSDIGRTLENICDYSTKNAE